MIERAGKTYDDDENLKITGYNYWLKLLATMARHRFCTYDDTSNIEYQLSNDVGMSRFRSL